MMISTFSTLATTELSQTLARLGFTPVSSGAYEHDAFRLAVGPHWCLLEAPAAAAPQLRSALAPGSSDAGISSASEVPSADLVAHISAPEDGRTSPMDLGAPGLWKTVGPGPEPRLVFALPRRIWDQAASSDVSFDGDITVLDQCLLWAFDTAQGCVAPEWRPPSRATVESWFKPEQLTVVAGPLLRQGEVICEPDRFAIRFLLVPELPPDLSESRLAWLRVLLDETQDHWHLVRLGLAPDDDGQSRVIAEVDLTGVPQSFAEDLFVISLEALRWVVQWLGETTDWLADATVASELLAVCPETNRRSDWD